MSRILINFDDFIMTKLFAHRGESFYEPENTIEAIKLAWDNNADGIEIDVRLTSDNKIVVIHDRNTRRTTGKYGRVNSRTLAELKNIDASIPSLYEVLALTPRGKTVMIEIKCGIEIIPLMKKLLVSTHMHHSQILLAGFGLKKMTEIKKAFPGFVAFRIKRIDSENLILKSLRIDRMIATCRKSKLDGVSLSYSRWLNKKNITKIKASGLKVFIWTVDNPKRALRLKNLGIDGIITNRSSWIREKIK
jgi:glycerophosphoryl diester phosphodiesterase